MINGITIKNVACYDPENGVEIRDLTKVNFIYGANGSGKTIISNLLYNSDDVNFHSCALDWQHNQQIKCLVYNKEFRERNFDNGNIEGVFTLGQATKEEIELIEKKQTDLKELKKVLIQKKEILEKQKENKQEEEDSFRDKTWTAVYKKYENSFKQAFVGVIKKEAFKKKLLSEYDKNTTDSLTLEEIKEKSNTIFGKVPEIVPSIKIINFNRFIEIEEDLIWGRKIIGKSDVDIASLIQNLIIMIGLIKVEFLYKKTILAPFVNNKPLQKNSKSS